jgi:cytidylate kinase
VASLSESDLVRITELVVKEIASEGRVVLVGRGAPAVLGRQSDALYVKVVAPRDHRIRIAAARLGVPSGEAARVLDDADKMRARYHREYYDRDWSDPSNYHMVLNTEALGVDGAAAVVVGRAREMGWR